MERADRPNCRFSSDIELYVNLFGQVANLLRGKHLLIVPSGPLTSIPFHVLVTEKPDKPIPDLIAGYRAATCLAKQNAITILPSVASLQALRQLPPSQAREPYIAFGNPLLLGRSGNDKSLLTLRNQLVTVT